MNWTAKHPTQTGYYWFHLVDPEQDYHERPFIVFVSFDGLIETAHVQRCGVKKYFPLVEFIKTEDNPFGGEDLIPNWFGPLKTPGKEG